MHRIIALFVYIKRRFFKDVVIWYGNYQNWSEALKHCNGYDHPRILEKVKQSSLKVKNGEAAYERDSVIFMKPRSADRLIKEILILEKENKASIQLLDFGGSLGSIYYQNKNVLGLNTQRSWSIVEQSHFVDAGKQDFEDDILKFYYSIEECTSVHPINIILCAGVIQCLENPYEWLDKLIKLNANHIILNRTSMIDDKESLLTIQYVPESIIESSYPCWFFVKNDLIFFMEKYGYKLKKEWYDIITKPIFVEGRLCTWQNLIFEKYD